MGPQEEFELFDGDKSWPSAFQQLQANDAARRHEYSLQESKRAENRSRNRYRDVVPYDHSRVHLQRNSIDYINASLVVAREADRAYILTQGPLPDTAGHFWLMVWEQKSNAILMLNRIIEKGQLKCHPYYPTGCENDGDDEMEFTDVGLRVSFVEERESNSHYTARALQLTDLASNETREIIQFHYTAWPDFGVPASPGAFLDFLWAVRLSGALDGGTIGPPVIHCSAGIGRSGTFCLVDASLVLVEKHGSAVGLRVRELLMDMRRYRMGLVQTFDQLRFSYLAIIEGIKRIVRVPSLDSGFENNIEELTHKEDFEDEDEGHPSSATKLSDDDDTDYDDEESDESLPPPLPPRLIRNRVPVSSIGDKMDIPVSCNGLMAPDGSSLSSYTSGDKYESTVDDNVQYSKLFAPPLVEIRRRCHTEREKSSAEEIARMKQNQIANNIRSSASGSSSFHQYFLGAATVAFLAFGSFAFYRYYFK